MDRFLRACRRQPVDRTPVWLMRQAGRHLPEYRALRERHSVLELCRTPELATEVTLQPLRRFDVDAALVFSHPIVPLAALGFQLDHKDDERPGCNNPIRGPQDIERMSETLREDDLDGPIEAVRLIKRELDGRRPVLGSASGPFTLACYALAAGPETGYEAVRSLMHGNTAAWHALMGRLAAAVLEFLRHQVSAGADALQVNDSWVGVLDEADYRSLVLPYARQVFDGLGDLDVPTIHFGVGTAHLLEALRDAGGDVIGVDWRVPLDEAWDRIGRDRAIQGNLDPTLLVRSAEDVLSGAAEVLARAGGRPGHIFNLGHGLLPSTRLEQIQALVRYVHRS